MRTTSEQVNESELSNKQLLAQALQEAMDAYANGELGGPGLDEVQLKRAARRARRADANHLLNTQIPFEGAVA